MANNLTERLSLLKPIYEGRGVDDLANMFAALETNMDIVEKVTSGTIDAETNASIVALNGNRFANIYSCSPGSIATISGALAYVPFTLIMMTSGASFGLIGTADGAIELSYASWIPGYYETIELIWDGFSFIELMRTSLAQGV
jgi:hypothetical protein